MYKGHWTALFSARPKKAYPERAAQAVDNAASVPLELERVIEEKPAKDREDRMSEVHREEAEVPANLLPVSQSQAQAESKARKDMVSDRIFPHRIAMAIEAAASTSKAPSGNVVEQTPSPPPIPLSPAKRKTVSAGNTPSKKKPRDSGFGVIEISDSDEKMSDEELILPPLNPSRPRATASNFYGRAGSLAKKDNAPR